MTTAGLDVRNVVTACARTTQVCHTISQFEQKNSSFLSLLLLLPYSVFDACEQRCCQLSGDCVCCCVAFRPARSESELASASLYYHSLPLKYVFLHLRISQEDWTGWWTVKLVWLCFKIVYLKHNGHSLEMDASVFADRLSKPSILRNIWITHWTITTLSGLRDKRRLGNDQPSVDFG